jgi:GDPmannose 4,6-dehydratase
MKIVFIASVTGKNVAYLIQFFLKKEYLVHGFKRKYFIFFSDIFYRLLQNLYLLNKNFILHYGI